MAMQIVTLTSCTIIFKPFWLPTGQFIDKGRELL